MKPHHTRLGIMFRREHAPESLPQFAKEAEAAGFDELWIVEDCFYTSGVALVSTALAVTESITIGLGIMPAPARNPVFTAMEIATLAGMYPGRFLPGIGHGVAEWMRQIGAFPASQLAAIEEVTHITRQLLAGENLTFSGRHARLEDCQLIHPPAQIPPISLGVIGPKSLEIAGRVADGTILSEYASPAYVAWAKKQIERGRQNGNRRDPHRLTLFSFTCAAASQAEACQMLRPMLARDIASGGLDAKLAPMGILDSVKEMRARGGQAALENQMPDEWIAALTLAGTPADWCAAIQIFASLGIDSVVLVPRPEAGVAELNIFSEQIKNWDADVESL